MNGPTTIETVSPRWQKKFDLLEKVCGGHITSLSAILWNKAPAGGQKPTFKDTLILTCWPAFVFGFLWYFYKGMWKKALVFVGISVVLSVLLDIFFGEKFETAALGVGIGYSMFVGRMATVDYYRQLKHGFNDWW